MNMYGRKQSLAAIEAIEKVQKEVEAAIMPKAGAGQPRTEDDVSNLGELGSQALLKYVSAAAQHMRSVSQELLAFVESQHNESVLIAEDLEHLAKKQADHIIETTSKARELANGFSKLKEDFMRLVRPAEMKEPVPQPESEPESKPNKSLSATNPPSEVA